MMPLTLSKRNFLKGMAAVAAGGLAAAQTAQAKPKADLPAKWDREADVVILGYGGAGACAAITAKDAGADVVIFEKCAQGGGNTAVSSGGMFIPNDRDRAFTYLNKIYDYANSVKDVDLLNAFVDEAMKSKDFLLSLAPDQKLYIYGHAGFQNIPESDAVDKWRFRTPKGQKTRGGDMLFNNYRYAVEEARKIPVVYNARAMKLITENDEVLGVEIEIEGKMQAVKAKRAVVLATGGFEYDDNMLANHTLGQKFHRLGHPGNTGDGVRMAQAAGADLWHMSALSCPLGLVVPGLVSALQINMLAPSYIYVDQDGKRFASEKMDTHTCIYGVNMLDSVKHRYPRIPCYVVFDEAARQKGPIIGGATSGYALNREGYQWSKDNSAEIEKGVIVTAPTLEELAKKINVPAEQLVATVKTWNENIAGGADKEFGRPIVKKGKVVQEGREAPVLSAPLGDGPYYAAALYPTLLNTQGGPRRNKLGQVLDPFGKPVARLYSAGELGSMWGHIYQGATNNSEACVFGRIAGRTAAGEKPWA
jgi:succinate dehydrogenase/fumarate reductase flavoprotein subunit